MGPHPHVAMGSAYARASTLGRGLQRWVRERCSARCGSPHFIPVTALYKYL